MYFVLISKKKPSFFEKTIKSVVKSRRNGSGKRGKNSSSSFFPFFGYKLKLKYEIQGYFGLLYFINFINLILVVSTPHEDFQAIVLIFRFSAVFWHFEYWPLIFYLNNKKVKSTHFFFIFINMFYQFS